MTAGVPRPPRRIQAVQPDHPHRDVQRHLQPCSEYTSPAPKSQGEHNYTCFNVRSTSLGATEQTRVFRGEIWSHGQKNLECGVSTKPTCWYLPDVQEDLVFLCHVPLTLLGHGEEEDLVLHRVKHPWDPPSHGQSCPRHGNH